MQIKLQSCQLLKPSCCTNPINQKNFEQKIYKLSLVSYSNEAETVMEML